jgi:uncharacterized protein YcbK (DUF882 family)
MSRIVAINALPRWRYFTLDEFRCKHSGANYICHRFVDVLDEYRDECGFPLTVTSGYRSPTHPIEAAKTSPGWHSKGKAVDFYIPDGVKMRRAVELAVRAGFPGIGVGNRMLHLDLRDTTPVVWGY